MKSKKFEGVTRLQAADIASGLLLEYASALMTVLLLD